MAPTYIRRIACLRAVEGSANPEALLDSEQSRLLTGHPRPGDLDRPQVGRDHLLRELGTGGREHPDTLDRLGVDLLLAH